MLWKSRRRFIKCVLGGTAIFFLAAQSRQNTAQAAARPAGHEGFVIWNGWVLKSTDLDRME